MSPDRNDERLCVQVVSDLHIEFLARFPGWHGVMPNPLADLLILAGDIGTIDEVIEHFGDWPVPALWVLGNHEFYDQDMPEVRVRAKRAAKRTSSLVVLDNDQLDLHNDQRYDECFCPRQWRLKNVRILGSTLWTDYAFSNDGADQRSDAERMEEAGRQLNDHRLIRNGGVTFRPDDALAEHHIARRWLASKLLEPFDGRTLVITHHAPDPGSIHSRFCGNPLNSAFVSALPDLLSQADVWVHGHVHDGFSYESHGCRVVANPRGYPTGGRWARDPSELRFENPSFEPDLLIKV
ncbi:MAG TPA: metallophosphoesterase [Burkholderiaceae bacterium]|nr:metallophosphoesterase [Burkholderiaceae bacterium]